MSAESTSGTHLARLAVAQIDGIPHTLTWAGRHWIPAEPLATSSDPSLDLGELAAAQLFAEVTPDPADILQRIEKMAREAAEQKLSDLLRQAASESIDLLVLPELLMPITAVKIIQGYSQGRTIVAGLGLVINHSSAEMLASIAAEDIEPDDLVSRNIAVLVHNGDVHLITKRNPADHEVMAEGTGPRVFEVSLRGRPARIAVAICMDALHDSTILLTQNPDIVCIPAYSRTTDSFFPGPPRDYVRMVSNAAAFGGSTISAPGVKGPAFSESNKVRPIPAGVEGIIAVDFLGVPTKPTPLNARMSTVALRSELIERKDDDTASTQAVRILSEVRTNSTAISQQVKSDISLWIEHIPEPSLLVDALRQLRVLFIQEVEDDQLLRLLCGHFMVTPGAGVTDVRKRQASFVIKRIGEFLAIGEDIPGVGRKLDQYGAVSGDTKRSPKSDDEDSLWTFAIRLGRYDRETAASSLPRQLNLLRAISDLPPSSLKVTYRIQAVESEIREDSIAFFDVVVTGRDEHLSRDDIEAQFRSIMVSSWSVTSSDEDRLPRNARHHVRLTLPYDAHIPALREDWSSVIDLLRTHLGPVTIDMQVARAAHESGRSDDLSSTDDQDERFFRSFGALPYVSMLSDSSERFAGAFHAMREEAGHERRNLELSIVISSRDPLPGLLVRTVARELLGTIDFDLDYIPKFEHQAGGPAFTASEVLRIFHPPYGKVQGRGVVDPEPYQRFFVGKRAPASGVLIGTARLAGPRADRDLDIRLDDNARSKHLYVIGKTGTGKTNLLKEIARQDLEEGRGLCVIDPHGDLVDYLAEHVGDRVDDTVLLDFGDDENVCGFNPLLIDCETLAERNLHVTDFISVLQSQFYNQYSGPRFNDLVRLAVDTMLDRRFPVPPSISLIEEMYENRYIRGSLIELFKNTRIGQRWELFESVREGDKAELMSWALSKFAALMPVGSLIRSQLSAPKTGLSIRDAVHQRKILLVKIPDSRMGADASTFLASLVLKRIARAVFSSPTSGSRREGTAYGLLIDEFQRVATAGLEPFVAEARKFNCGLVLAHQNLEQLNAFSTYEGARSRELTEVILGNVGSVVAFRVGPQDVDVISQLLGGREADVRELRGYRALCRVVIDGTETAPFTLGIPDSARKRGLPVTGETLRAAMIERGYSLPRAVAEAHGTEVLANFEASLAENAAQHQRATLEKAAEILRDPEKFYSVIDNYADPEAVVRALILELSMYHLGASQGVALQISDRLWQELAAESDDENELSDEEMMNRVARRVVDHFGGIYEESRLQAWIAALMSITTLDPSQIELTPEWSAKLLMTLLGLRAPSAEVAQAVTRLAVTGTIGEQEHPLLDDQAWRFLTRIRAVMARNTLDLSIVDTGADHPRSPSDGSSDQASADR